MLLRFLQSALKFIVAVLSLRSNHSVFLLDASDYSNDLLHKSISNTKGNHTGTSNPMPSEVHEQSTIQWTPAATDLGINTDTIVSYAPSAIPPFYTSPALGESGFNWKSKKSIAPTYSAWKTHSIYRLPGSTTLSLILPPSGEYIRVKYEPPPKPNCVVKFIGEMWHLTKVIVGYILWMTFIITVIFIWLRFYF